MVMDTTATAVPAMAAPHPDAALIQAYEDWLQLIRDAEALSPGYPGYYEDLERISDRMTAASERIAGLPALTPRGAACKVRWAWAKLSESASAEHTLAYGNTADPEDVSDWRHRTLWELAADLDRMGGVA